MKRYIKWKVCIYCFLQAHHTLHQSMSLGSFCFTASATFITRGNALTEPQFSVTFLPLFASVSCRLCKLVQQHKPVPKVCLCIDHVHTGHLREKADEDRFDTTAALNWREGETNQGRVHRGGTKFCMVLGVQEKGKLQLIVRKQ